MTGNPTGMVECQPHRVGRRRLVVGHMRPLRIECFGKLSLAIHCAKADVDVKLSDVAYVPGVKLNLFPPHAVMHKCNVTLDANGVHTLGASLPCVLMDLGS